MMYCQQVFSFAVRHCGLNIYLRTSHPHLCRFVSSYKSLDSLGNCCKYLESSKIQLPCLISLLHSRTFHCQQRLENEKGNRENETVCDAKNGPWRILFFGTDSFSLPHLEVLNTARKSSHVVSKLEVVVPETKYVKRRGRTRRLSPVWKYCQDNELTFHHWPLQEAPTEFDLGVIVSFGHLLPGWLIASFPLGILNVHPSLLPRWRGGAPIQHTILNGDTTSGVSIMRILPNRFDVGPIVLQRECAVPERSTSRSLSKILSRLGSEMLLEVLSDVRGYINKETPQSDHGVTLGRKIPSSLGWVNWKSSVQHIDRLYRAIGEQTYLKTLLGEEELRLEDMIDPEVCSGIAFPTDGIPGSVMYDRRINSICVRCRDGWVGFRSVSPIGKKKMSAQDFHNGYLSSLGGTGTLHFMTPTTLDR